MVAERTYFSVGGGFVLERGGAEPSGADRSAIPFPFATGGDLLAHADKAARDGLSIRPVVAPRGIGVLLGLAGS